MSEEEIKKICEYIRIHKPQADDFDTINAAIKAVTGNGDYKAATEGEMVGDDIFLLSQEQANRFAGIRLGPGSWQGFTPNQIQMILDAVETAKSVQNYDEDYNDLEDIAIAIPIESNVDEFKPITDDNKLNEIELPDREKNVDNILPINDFNKIDSPHVETIKNNPELKSMIDDSYIDEVSRNFLDIYDTYKKPDDGTMGK